MRNTSLPWAALAAMLGITAASTATIVAIGHSRVPASIVPASPAAKASNDPISAGYTATSFSGVYVRHIPGGSTPSAGSASLYALPGAKLSDYKGHAVARRRATITTLPNGVRRAEVGSGFLTNETAEYRPRSAFKPINADNDSAPHSR